MNPWDLQLDEDIVAILMGLPVEARRQTALRTAGACLRRYHGQYVDPGAPDEWDIGPPGRYGSTWHNWVGEYATKCLAAHVETDVALARELIGTYEARVPGGHVADFRDLCERHIEMNPIVPPGSVVEKIVGVTADGLPAQRGEGIAHGTLDRAWVEEDCLCVLDEKTDHHTPPAGELARHFQPLFYASAALVCLKRPAARVKAMLRYVRSGIVREIELSVRELQEWWHTEFRARMMKIATAYITRDWPATPTSGYEGCDGCPFVTSTCPFSKQLALSPSAAIADLGRQKVADMFLFAKAFVKAAEAALKADVSANGPIEMSNHKVLGYHPRNTTIVDDLEVVVTALMNAAADREAMKVAVWKALNAPKGKIVKLAKELTDPARRDALWAELDVQFVLIQGQVFQAKEVAKKAKEEGAA